MTGLVLDYSKIQKLVFLLHEVLVTLSRNAKWQTNRQWSIKFPIQFMKFLYINLKAESGVQNGTKIWWPAYFKETNSSHEVKLILTPMFRDLTKQKKSTLLARTETLFTKMATFQGKSFIICLEICLECATSA